MNGGKRAKVPLFIQFILIWRANPRNALNYPTGSLANENYNATISAIVFSSV